MKRLAALLAGACAACVGIVAAPALSTAPYRAEPVDFELAPGAPAVSAAGGDAVSRPLRAPGRFNLVGLRWRGAAEPRVAVRVRKKGDDWSSWKGLAVHSEDGPDPGSREDTGGQVSSPLWVGEADQVQYRTSRRVAGVKLHFVNVEGTATGADRVRTAARRVANLAVTTAASVLGGEARGQEPQPAMVPRSQWARGDCEPRSGPEYGSVKAAFVHHTVSLNDYSAEESPGIVLSVCRYHRNSNGWKDIGYNFVVDKYGVLYEGRAGGADQPVVGAQAQGYNAQTTGIANLGNHSSVAQSPQGLQAMARLIRWKLPLHGVPTTGPVTVTSAGGSSNRYGAGAVVRIQRVSGHRDTNSTACPGSALYAQLGELRRLVAGAVPGPQVGVTLRPVRRAVAYGRVLGLSGRALDPEGAPIAGELVEIQQRIRRVWRTLQTPTTAPDGSFGGSLRLKKNRLVRARYPGRPGLPATTSASVLLKVKPRIALRRPPRRARRGRRVKLRGKVTPAKRKLYQVLELRQRRPGRRGRFRRVGVRNVWPRRGRFTTFFVPARRGAYRFYFSSAPDRTSAVGRSKRYLVRVR